VDIGEADISGSCIFWDVIVGAYGLSNSAFGFMILA